MRDINFYGSLSDFKKSIGMSTDPTPPSSIPGFTPGAYVETELERRKKLNADPNLYRMAQDYVAARNAEATFAMNNQDPFGAGMAASKRDKAEEYVRSGRKNVGQGINKRKKIKRMK
jgi:hypothetical protein